MRLNCYHFMLIMKQQLNIPPGQEGAAWHYRAAAKRHPTHRHDELEVNLVIAGEADYLVDGRRYVLDRGSMLWLFPDQDHHLLREGRGFEMWIGVFQPRLVRRWAREPAQRPWRSRNPKGESLRRLQRSAAGRLERRFADAAEAQRCHAATLANAALAHLMLAAWRAFAEALAPTAPATVHAAVRRAVDLLRSGGLRDDSLPALAAAVGLSPSRLSHLFREQTGITLTTYRNRQRIERFVQLTGSRPHRDMLSNALDAGFGSYAQFHRIFTQVMGRGPRAWAREAQREP